MGCGCNSATTEDKENKNCACGSGMKHKDCCGKEGKGNEEKG